MKDIRCILSLTRSHRKLWQGVQVIIIWQLKIKSLLGHKEVTAP